MRTGVGNYASHLLRSLQALAPGNIAAYPSDWVLGLERNYRRFRQYVADLRALRKTVGGPLGSLSRLVHQCARELARTAGARWHVRTFFGQRYSLYHEPNFIPFPSSLPTVTTFHDLSAIVHPEWHPADRLRWFDQNLDRTLAQSRHFLADSEFTRQEIIRVLGVSAERVTRAYVGIRPGLGPLPAAEVEAGLRRRGLPPRYLLYLGTIEPRKNVRRLLQAYCTLPEPVRAAWPLLLAGSWGWKSEEEREFYHAHARHRGVLHVGYVADQDATLLYNGARALVYPSHYEGFGLPPVEMLSCGGAVLTSTAAALVETVGGQAHQVEAEDTDGWRRALLRVTQDDDWWQSLRVGAVAAARAYSWERCARETLQVYRAVLGEGPALAKGSAGGAPAVVPLQTEPTPPGGAFDFSVIIPLLQGQGKELVCLRSWTHKQTLPRQRYQVILASTGADPELDRQAAALLQPHDRMLRLAGSEHQIYRDAARHAEGDVLFFTELHCQAHRNCLAAMARWLQDHPHLAGGCARSIHANLGPVSELVGKLFDTDVAEWSLPGHWKRVLIRGFAIRRAVYEAVGGHEGELHLFADTVLAARLHRAGQRIGMVEAAQLTHRNTNDLAEIREVIRGSARGEHRFRLRADSVAWEEYLGLPEPWAATLAERQEDPFADARLLTRLLGRCPWHSLVLLRMIAGKLLAGLIGPRWRLRQLDIQARWALLRFQLLTRVGAADPFRHFLAHWRLTIHKELVRVALRDRLAQPAAGLPAGAYLANQVPLAAWSGIHALEQSRAGPFRWTKPLFRLRWQLPTDVPAWDVTVETAGIRPGPRALLLGAFWNGRTIAASDIEEEGARLRLRVGAGLPAGMNELLVVCLPLIPRRRGSADPRRLGLPVSGVAIRAAGSPASTRHTVPRAKAG